MDDNGGGTMLAYLGHEFIMIPVIRLYNYIGGGIGISLCIITSLLVTILLSEKRIVKFFSPLLDFSVLCEKLKINIYK